MKINRKGLILISLIILLGLNILCQNTFAAEAVFDVEVYCENSLIKAKVDLSDENIDGIFIGALYKNDILISTACTKAEDKAELIFPEGTEGEKIEVFLWQNKLSLKPLEVSVLKDVIKDELWGKKLYVDGDSICYGVGYKGGYGKIIADKYNMELINNGVGGGTISNMGATNKVAYEKELDWDNTKYYLKLVGFNPSENKTAEGFAVPLTKEIYENGYGKYPKLYKMIDGELKEQAWGESLPIGQYYVKFEIPTYGNNTVSKYVRTWHYIEDGVDKGYFWLWEAYKNGFKEWHMSNTAEIGTARHWICDSINNIDTSADYIIFEGGINDYLMNRPLGKLSSSEAEAVDTTTVIGGLEYICRILKEKCADKNVLYLITHKSLTHTTKPNSTAGGNKTWQEYHDAILETLKRYNIEYVDMFETEFDTSQEKYLEYTHNRDGVHPTKEGYELYFVPHIEKKLH